VSLKLPADWPSNGLYVLEKTDPEKDFVIIKQKFSEEETEVKKADIPGLLTNNRTINSIAAIC